MIDADFCLLVRSFFFQKSLQLFVAELFAVQAKGTDRPIELVVGIGNHTAETSQLKCYGSTDGDKHTMTD